jgi:hypothetical protein
MTDTASADYWTEGTVVCSCSHRNHLLNLGSNTSSAHKRIGSSVRCFTEGSGGEVLPLTTLHRVASDGGVRFSFRCDSCIKKQTGPEAVLGNLWSVVI